MLTSKDIKKYAKCIGAEMCGIANVERFENAPLGFKPTDIYKDCKSVIAFLKTMPPDTILTDTPITYTHTSSTIYLELDRIGLELCRIIERKGAHAVLVPCDTPYFYWNPETMRGMGILSMRHTGYLAGLGILGRNTLLMNKKFGNMIHIGAILINTSLEADPIITDFSCPPKCKKCLDACSKKALDGITVDQYLCRQNSITETAKEYEIYVCNKCRLVCPYRTGFKSKSKSCD
jgi:epoxyqueuosine reductase